MTSKTPRIVTIDNGNTNPHVGFFINQKLTSVIPLKNYIQEPDDIILMASVGEPLTIQATFDLKNLRKKNALFVMPIFYSETLGVDRLYCAYFIFQKINPENRVLIIDAGTFMTADIIESKGFMGGYIFPGSKTFLQSYSLGKQLPVIKKIESNEALPHSTEEAISMAHEIYLDSVLKELMNKHSPKKVIITGGDGEKILLKMKKISSTIPLEFDPHLLHFAIHSIYQNHLKDQ